MLSSQSRTLHDISTAKAWTAEVSLLLKPMGTHRDNSYDIIEDTLNLKATKVIDYIENEKGSKVACTNRNETIAAQEKQEIIKNEFSLWIFSDAERRADLTRVYNERFNAVRLREFDDSYLTFPECRIR